MGSSSPKRAWRAAAAAAAGGRAVVRGGWGERGEVGGSARRAAEAEAHACDGLNHTHLEELPVLHATLQEDAPPRERCAVRHLILLVLVLGAHAEEREHREEQRELLGGLHLFRLICFRFSSSPFFL